MSRVTAVPGARARLCGLLLAVVFLFSVSGAALAHAVLVRSDPAANAKLPNPPKVVSLYFSEPLEAKFSSAQVVDAQGARFDSHDSRVDAGDPTHMTVGVQPLKPGFYSVVWKTVSHVDGHELRGSFPFIILQPDGSLPVGQAAPVRADSNTAGTASTGPVDVAAYWLSILGAVALFGGLLFTLIVARPAAHALGGWALEVRERALTLELRLLWGALSVFAVGELITLARELGNLGGTGSLGSFLTGTGFGQYWALRALLALVCAGLLLLLQRMRSPENQTPVLCLAALLAFGVLLCFSLTSHAAAIGNGSFWATLADLVHLAMVGVWVGGLISLLVLLLGGVRWLERPARIRYHAAVVARFSPLATAAVALILASGAFSAIVEIPSARGLTSTGYGRALLIKLALIVPLLAIGGVNAFILRPRLLDDACASDVTARREAERLSRRLYRTVAVETGLAAVVLLSVSLLVILPPARGLLAAGKHVTPQANGSSIYTNTATANDLTVQLNVDPNRVGENTFTVRLTSAGVPVSDALQVRLDFAYSDPSFGRSQLLLPPAGGGAYRASGANFAQVGRWQVEVAIRRAGKDDALTSFTVEAPDAAGNLTSNRRSLTDAFASPSTLFTTDELGGVLLVLGGLLSLVLRRRIWDFGVAVGAIGTFMGVGALMLGATLFFAAHSHGPSDLALLTNPVPVTDASIADGKTLFQQNCAVCHGTTGHGDGPAARTLNPQPVDLTVHVGLHPDGILWGWITYGIPRTAMPAWKGRLTDTQRWDIVNFLRADFQSAAVAPPSSPTPAQAAAAAWAAALSAESSGATR